MPPTVRARTPPPKRPRDGTSRSSRGRTNIRLRGDSMPTDARYRRAMAHARRRPRLPDVVLAGVVLAVSLGTMSHGGWNREGADGGRELDALGAGLAIAMTLPLVVRRLRPIPVFTVVTVATGTLYGLGYAFPPLAFAVALYTVARWPDETAPRVRTAVLTASVAVLLGPAIVRNGLGPELVWGAFVWA